MPYSCYARSLVDLTDGDIRHSMVWLFIWSFFSSHVTPFTLSAEFKVSAVFHVDLDLA